MTRWMVRVVVLKKAAISEEDMPSSYLLHMRGSVLLARSLRHHLSIKQHATRTIVYWCDRHTTKLMSHDCTEVAAS